MLKRFFLEECAINKHILWQLVLWMMMVVVDINATSFITSWTLLTVIIIINKIPEYMGSGGGLVALSQVPGSPSFQTHIVNAVAVIPLLSSDCTGQDDPTTHSSQSFQDLMHALQHLSKNSVIVKDHYWWWFPIPIWHIPPDIGGTTIDISEKFHWQHGWQCLQVFGRHHYNNSSRLGVADDQILNPTFIDKRLDWFESTSANSCINWCCELPSNDPKMMNDTDGGPTKNTYERLGGSLIVASHSYQQTTSP
jgi:hypothetical protein